MRQLLWWVSLCFLLATGSEEVFIVDFGQIARDLHDLFLASFERHTAKGGSWVFWRWILDCGAECAVHHHFFGRFSFIKTYSFHFLLGAHSARPTTLDFATKGECTSLGVFVGCGRVAHQSKRSTLRWEDSQGIIVLTCSICGRVKHRISLGAPRHLGEGGNFVRINSLHFLRVDRRQFGRTFFFSALFSQTNFYRRICVVFLTV